MKARASSAAGRLGRAGAVLALAAAAGGLGFTLLGLLGAAAPEGGAALGSPAACGAYSGLPAGFGTQPRAGMLQVPGGEFEPGTLSGYPDERPAGRVKVASFWIDRTEVSNAQFAAFVKATGYVTDAEREGAAAVFVAPPAGQEAAEGSWWRYVRGASWRHPEGPGSELRGRMHDPVVQVTQADASAYAHWLGHELPTEAQWEYAARANGAPELLERQPRDARGKPLANFWQGIFPERNSGEDGYVGRSPVGCFPANGFGLHDMIGNVWEWTREPYTGPRQGHGNGDPFATTAAAASLRPDARMVVKGGSFLCSENYCARYRATARQPQEANLPAAHVGFRTVMAQR